MEMTLKRPKYLQMHHHCRENKITIKQRIMWQNNMPPTDGSSVGACRWCNHLTNASEVALASVLFRPIMCGHIE